MHRLAQLAVLLNFQCPHSCRKCYNDCLNKLMTLCDSEDVLDFNRALKPSFKGTKLKKIAETIDSETYVVVTGSKAQTAVDTVVQLYPVDTHTASKAYCNLLTCKYGDRSPLLKEAEYLL
ncbi:hypothetical protein V5799_006999 [Amblyomma americanum]|uniref:Uncharacterized protein n=1 Tax=Amblyomma americanum TaxID=6943 RepID=A0AAQ4DUT9_AMBAM